MRKSKEWNVPLGKKPAVFVVDVAEVSSSLPLPLPTAPSSSSLPTSVSSSIPTSQSHDDEAVIPGRTPSSFQPILTSNKSEGTETIASTSNDSIPGSDSRNYSNLSKKNGEVKEEILADQVDEDSSHTAWYRIIYKVCEKIFLSYFKLYYHVCLFYF